MKITKYKTYLFRTVKKKLNLSLSKSHATLDFNFFDNTNKIEVMVKENCHFVKHQQQIIKFSLQHGVKHA
jgi:hypothetical protein